MRLFERDNTKQYMHIGMGAGACVVAAALLIYAPAVFVVAALFSALAYFGFQLFGKSNNESSFNFSFSR